MNNNSSSLDTNIEDDKTKKSHLLVVGFGSVVSGKYMRFIENYIGNNVIDGYSIIDIESQREVIKSKVKNILVRPKNKFYLTDGNTGKDIEKLMN